MLVPRFPPLVCGPLRLNRDLPQPAFCDGSFDDEPQRNCEPLQLVVRPQEELRLVVARVAFDLLHLHLGGGQRLARLDVFAGVLRDRRPRSA